MDGLKKVRASLLEASDVLPTLFIFWLVEAGNLLSKYIPKGFMCRSQGCKRWARNGYLEGLKIVRIIGLWTYNIPTPPQSLEF